MAMIHGKSGSINWGGTGEETTITSWSLEVSGDVAEATNMSSTADWKEYLGGFKGYTATVECNFNATDPSSILTDLAGTARLLNLYVTGTTGFVCTTAILTGFSFKTDANGIETITYTFQGTGALTYA